MNMTQKREARKKAQENVGTNDNVSKSNINWYPGHMAKTKRKIKENLDLIDIVFELLDARIPKTSKIKEIESLIKNKPRVLILTKLDLCDQKETAKWISHYEKEGYKVVPLDLESGNINKLLKATSEVMEDINQKRANKGMKKRRTRAIMIGIPNVGKSTLINRLVGKKAVRTGNRPGVTTSLDWIRISDELELMDTPGILWPKLDNEKVALNLASLTAIKEEILPLDEVATYILTMLAKHYPEKLKERYGVTTLSEDIIEIYDEIGKKRGCLIKGGEVDYDKVVMIIINDLKNGHIQNITFDRYKGE